MAETNLEPAECGAWLLCIFITLDMELNSLCFSLHIYSIEIVMKSSLGDFMRVTWFNSYNMLGRRPLVSTQSILTLVVANSTAMTRKSTSSADSCYQWSKMNSLLWVTEQPPGQDSHRHEKELSQKYL